ncbi:c-type cytochrome [Pelagibacterium luteolum]|uniref:Cytochrome c, mono-and diheme variants n=1 Tax=Pelagibacterium luteolum TaxID=440168 RepID=A0A1G7XBF9_9HYPH|nr:cytochrome c [Pelagibacterium luteolum]SDG81572.1 Cytochrome c, mono-and diheme variants [Pelagibacterium luteolum]
MIHSLSRLGAFTAIAFAFAAPAAFAQSDDELLELGREVFLEHAEPACGLCHTLADAETEGGIGPILDDLQPSTDQVRLAVTLGVGPMQPYTELSEEEIEALAFYVATVTGGTISEKDAEAAE